MRTKIVVMNAVMITMVGLSRADEKPLERVELDKRIATAAYESALLGTSLFNDDKNYEGCYRLYQGTLLAIVPLLDHRETLQAKVKLRLERAAENIKSGKWDAPKGAFELRTALDEILEEIAPSGGGKRGATIWERLGGETGVRKVVDDILLAAAEDPKINFFRGKKPDPKIIGNLRQTLVEMISENTGGPLKYTGKTMAEAHKGMKITDEEFDAFVDVIVKVLKKHKVDEADIKTLGKLLESTRKDIVEKRD